MLVFEGPGPQLQMNFYPIWTPQDRSSVCTERGGSPLNDNGSPLPSAEGRSLQQARALTLPYPGVCLSWACLSARSTGRLVKQTPATSDSCRTLPRLTGRACVFEYHEYLLQYGGPAQLHSILSMVCLKPVITRLCQRRTYCTLDTHNHTDRQLRGGEDLPWYTGNHRPYECLTDRFRDLSYIVCRKAGWKHPSSQTPTFSRFWS